MNYEYRMIEVSEDSKIVFDAMDMVWRVFEEFEAPDYSDEGIAEFQDFIEFNAISKRMLDNELFLWCCFADESIIGVIATRLPCHISLLFVNKKYHRQGIARGLYNKVLDYYEANSSYDEITVNSSPYAVEAYHRLGFTDTDTEQTVNGIRFIPMKHKFR